jgi:hypothetical protein
VALLPVMCGSSGSAGSLEPDPKHVYVYMYTSMSYACLDRNKSLYTLECSLISLILVSYI